MTSMDRDAVSLPGREAHAVFSCDDATARPVTDVSQVEQEEHTIRLLLTMALVYDHWGVNRNRQEQIDAYAAAVPGRVFADYLGHNVGALLVAPDGTLLDFRLNRNVALNSTLEHAELRAIRRAIDGANAAAGPRGIVPWSFGTLLDGFSVYVTLEPCSQCCGIMDLARIASVIYAQDDPGQCDIVHALYEIRHRHQAPPAPRPVRADFFPLWRSLDVGYRRFLAQALPGSRRGVTSFLETPEAYRIFEAAAEALDGFEVEYPANRALLTDARAFRARHPADPVESLLPG